MTLDERTTLLTPLEVAEYLNLRNRRGELDREQVYTLPIRKIKVGQRVRYAPGDVRLYLAMQSGAL